MNKLSVFSRRQFLASGTSVFACTVLAGSVPSQPELSVWPHAQNLLVLYRNNEACSRQFAYEFALKGCMTRELGNDPVRQWRDELRDLVLNDNYMLAGLGNWVDFTILRGLAAEHRRFPLMFARHVRHQPALEDWPSQHAQELLAATSANDTGPLHLFAENLHEAAPHSTAEPSLFSWII